MRWAPHVTVAAVVQRGEDFLVVEEQPDGHAVVNQPAGHLEPDESLLDAVIREVLEETAYRFEPTGIVGIYQWTVPDTERTYLRFCFAGDVTGPETGLSIDPDICAVHWMSREQVASGALPPRSPMVLRCIDDALLRDPMPLSLLARLTEQV
jgi:phosphatase NudJ